MKQPLEEFADGVTDVRAAIDVLRAEMDKRAERRVLDYLGTTGEEERELEQCWEEDECNG